MLKNKTPDVIGLVTNTAFNTKVGEVEKNPDYTKCITDNEFNKFSGEIFDAKLKKSNQQQMEILLMLNNVLLKTKNRKIKNILLNFFYW